MRLLAYILLFHATSLSVQASTPFACDGKFYTVLSIDNKSVLQELSVSSTETVAKRTIELSQPNRQITAIGMSVKDMHLYGLDFDTKELLKIDATGKVESLGVPENLNTDLIYWAGDVSAEGNHLIVIGHNRQLQEDTHIYRIALFSPNHYAGISSVISDLPTIITDIATDPVRGVMYCFDKQNRQIAVLGGSNVTHYQHQKISPYIESIFFDRSGQLFGYGATSEWEHNTLYAIDKLRGSILPISVAARGAFGDGCSCPYTLSFERTITPENPTSCEEITIDYAITNHTGTGRVADFEDILPEDFIIESVVDHTFTLATIESAEASNAFIIPSLDILKGENIIQIKVKLKASFEEKYETQALIFNLPLGLGENMLSDNPKTNNLQDANITQLLQSEDIELEDYLSFNCAKDTATITLPLQNGTVEWNDGSTATQIKMSEAGLYWVKAQNECLAIEDSIDLRFPAPPMLEMENQQRLKQGTTATLSFDTNIDRPTIQWSSTNDMELSCLDCLQPSFVAIQNSTYYLQLTDEYGCTFMDSTQVLVDPIRQLYIPTAFSPNDDGINDTFFIQSITQTATIKELMVIDRWGTVLYHIKNAPINDPQFGWNGAFNNQLVTGGTYLWIADVEYLDGAVEQLKGTIEVVLN